MALRLPVFQPVLPKSSEPGQRLSIPLTVRSRLAGDDVVGMANGEAFNIDVTPPRVVEPLDSVRSKD